jgi:hypothetical protein
MIVGLFVFLFLSVVESSATPIKPDLKKMIHDSEQAQRPFIPARAGWSESSSITVQRFPVLESISGDRVREQLQEELATIATPDPWVALGLVALILLMRKLRSIEAQRKRTAEVGEVPAPEVRQAA